MRKRRLDLIDRVLTYGLVALGLFTDDLLVVLVGCTFVITLELKPRGERK